MKSSGEARRSTLHKIGSVLTALLFLVAAVLVVFAVTVLVQSRSDPNDVFLFGYKPTIVQTGSMLPSIKINSVVIIKRIDFNQIKPGDVITYRLKNMFITHRVIDVSGAQLTVKGDANPAPDSEPVTAQNFVGIDAYRMNWMAPVITNFKTRPLQTFLRYAVPLATAVVLIWLVIALLHKFTDRRSHGDRGPHGDTL